jgi:hypothetical protein
MADTTFAAGQLLMENRRMVHLGGFWFWLCSDSSTAVRRYKEPDKSARCVGYVPWVSGLTANISYTKRVLRGGVAREIQSEIGRSEVRVAE